MYLVMTCLVFNYTIFMFMNMFTKMFTNMFTKSVAKSSGGAMLLAAREHHIGLVGLSHGTARVPRQFS